MKHTRASILMVGLFIGSLIASQLLQNTTMIISTTNVTLLLPRSSEQVPTLNCSYPIVDTGQMDCFDENGIIYPSNASDYFGQDANFQGLEFNYTDNEDGTISDSTTGLMWQQDPGEKKTWDAAVSGATLFKLADYDDWRLPTIKELYSLINFDGETGLSAEESVPYIDTEFFVFEYGDESAGERFIDSQYWTSTEYVSTTMNGDTTVFGVNFADGRIKGYPKLMHGEEKVNYVLYVRGNEAYGINSYVDNGDGTILDDATGLVWDQNDSGMGLNWGSALQWVQQKNAQKYLGYDDWRLPNIKELQSIVDYTRSPDTSASAAIDPLFNITQLEDDNWPFFWSSTTHKDGFDQSVKACYIAFGEAQGFMEIPPGSGIYNLLDVHGTGAQRSDPKERDPNDYPNGHGPQGDVILIFNYVRLVRGQTISKIITSENDDSNQGSEDQTDGAKISSFPLLTLLGIGLGVVLFEVQTKKRDCKGN